ncbi:isoprenoid synthase domain-containing protein [Cladorrhinum sp. PSN259]|nr:isoprenoid synthase domain-containing protein [Cladorrhinum sp. PSN259]
MPPSATALRLAAKFKGQTLRLPNLKGLLAKWPRAVSPHYPELKEIVESKIVEWIPDEHSRAKARKSAYLSSLLSDGWYPFCPIDRLQTMCWYSMWIFLWDDVIEFQDMPVRIVQQQALKYIEYHLGLALASAAEPPAPTKYCALFQHCAKPLRGWCTISERRRFLDQISNYMDGCEVEQKFTQSGKIPTLHEYWDHRLQTSSVWTYCAISDYMGGVHLPEEMFEWDELKALWFELNRHIVTLNDMVSFKKEVVKCSFHSLIPVVTQETGADLATVVDSLIKSLVNIGNNLDKAVDDLIARIKGNAELEDAVEKDAVGYRTNLTGNYWWSLGLWETRACVKDPSR